MCKHDACYMCDNARINEGLTDDNDLSFISVGSAEKNYRMMLSAGDGKSLCMLFEQWDGNQWRVIGIYNPLFCPNCGRKIDEYTI